MRVGVFTALLSQFPLDKVLEKLKSLNIDTVELGTGNYPGDPHCKLSMLDNENELKEWKKMMDDKGFHISALSCHGNPLHPDRNVAKAYQDTSKKTILLAEKLGVPVVIDFSGCPGDSDNAKYPNWVTCPWPPEYLEVLDWQWEKKVDPVLDRARQVRRRSWREDRDRNAPGLRGVQSGDDAETALDRRALDRLQLRSEPHVLARHRPDRRGSSSGRCDLPCTCEGHADLRSQSADDGRPGYEEVHGRAESRLDFPHLRLWPRFRLVEGIRLDAADVRLRLRAFDRA